MDAVDPPLPESIVPDANQSTVPGAAYARLSSRVNAMLIDAAITLGVFVVLARGLPDLPHFLRAPNVP
jgi:hypothetical protein